MSTISFKLVIVFCSALLCWAVYRDIHLEKQYAGDLRNRVVGARMQKDGLSPYFYKWKQGDGLRYYDPHNFDSLQVSNVTGSPFFHCLLYPVADLPQQTISRLWLLFEYAALALMLLMAFLIAQTQAQKGLVLLTGSLMLLTESWKAHIGAGQYYLFIPLLMLCFVYSIRKTAIYFSAVAGLCTAALLLIRPTTMFFFLPFLFLLKQYTTRWKIVFFLPFVLAIAWLLASTRQQYLWAQYRKNIAQQVLLHQEESPAVQHNASNPGYADWEGISKGKIAQEEAAFPIKIFSENGNVFVIVNELLHKKINKTWLSVIAAIGIIFLLMAFVIRHRASGFAMAATALLGFSCYMLTDIFSPVHRHQYYGVQWFFPLLLIAALYTPMQQKWWIPLGAGLLLTIVNLKSIPMEHTIGEYLLLLGCNFLSLKRETLPLP